MGSYGGGDRDDADEMRTRRLRALEESGDIDDLSSRGDLDDSPKQKSKHRPRAPSPTVGLDDLETFANRPNPQRRHGTKRKAPLEPLAEDAEPAEEDAPPEESDSAEAEAEVEAEAEAEMEQQETNEEEKMPDMASDRGHEEEEEEEEGWSDSRPVYGLNPEIERILGVPIGSGSVVMGGSMKGLADDGGSGSSSPVAAAGASSSSKIKPKLPKQLQPKKRRKGADDLPEDRNADRGPYQKIGDMNDDQILNALYETMAGKNDQVRRKAAAASAAAAASVSGESKSGGSGSGGGSGAPPGGWNPADIAASLARSQQHGDGDDPIPIDLSNDPHKPSPEEHQRFCYLCSRTQPREKLMKNDYYKELIAISTSGYTFRKTVRHMGRYYAQTLQSDLAQGLGVTKELVHWTPGSIYQHLIEDATPKVQVQSKVRDVFQLWQDLKKTGLKIYDPQTKKEYVNHKGLGALSRLDKMHLANVRQLNLM
jgi:hypothetical protein